MSRAAPRSTRAVPLGRRLGLLGALVALLPGTPAGAADEIRLGAGPCRARIELAAPGQDCLIRLEPRQATPGAPPPGALIWIAPDGYSRIELAADPGGTGAELVAQDRRLPFSPQAAPNPAALLRAAGWPTDPAVGPVHLTVSSADGEARSSVFCPLAPLDLVRAAKTHCAVRFAYATLPEGCDDAVTRARTQGGAQPQVLLSRCTLDLAALAERSLACRRVTTLATEVRTRLRPLLPESRIDGAADPDTTAVPLLNQAARVLRLRRGAAAAAADQARRRVRIDKARAAVAALEVEAAGLRASQTDLARPAGATAAPGGLTGNGLKRLIESLLGAGPCEQLTVEVAATGQVAISARLPSAAAEATLRARVAALAPALPDPRLRTEIDAAMQCLLPLGRWLVLAAAQGRPGRGGAPDPGRFLDALPYPDELNGLSAVADADGTLAPEFRPGAAPRVWCREGREIGVCERAPDAERWRFRPNGRGADSGFTLVLKERWR